MKPTSDADSGFTKNVLWSALAAITVAVGITVLVRAKQHHDAEVRLRVATAETGATANALRSRRIDLGAYNDFIDRYAAQRDEVMRDVADFDRELLLLTRKTSRLERVRLKLEELDREATALGAADTKFRKKLEVLQQNVGGAQ
jgi:hypothetical protein